MLAEREKVEVRRMKEEGRTDGAGRVLGGRETPTFGCAGT
jgi:hypothetical protein